MMTTGSQIFKIIVPLEILQQKYITHQRDSYRHSESLMILQNAVNIRNTILIQLNFKNVELLKVLITV